LEQSLNSDLPGDIKALISSKVFDTATGRYLLVPQSSRLVGKYDSRISYGQDGVQVVWERIIFPDASSVDINGMVGLDAHGNSGLRYDVDHHYKRLFGFAALTSAFTAAFGERQPRYESSKSTVKNDAIRLLNQRRSEIDNRQISSGTATVGDLLDLYLADQRKQKRHGYKQADGYVRLHLKPAFGKVKASAIQ
jgi:type IV secretion system protein VirB10